MRRLLLPLGLAVLYFNPAFAQPLADTPAGASGMSGAVPLSANGTKAWTLESATRRVLEVAPERRLSDTVVDMRQEELNQAGVWPNPSIELRADDRIGQLSGQGGTSLTQLALSQPLPFRRIARQRAAAESGLSAAQANRQAQFLLLEREAARVFHALQFAAAKRQLAKERLGFTNNFAAGRTTTYGDHLKRYLTPLELGRLALMREEARQAAMLAERDYENARIGFRSLLGLADGAVEAALPVSPTRPPSFEVLARELDRHPAIEAARHETEAAEGGVEVAESQRYADPVLKLFRDRDFNNGATINVIGIGVGIEIPLWSRNRALEGKAKAEADASRARYEAQLRDARIRLEQAYAQLSRLQNQTSQMSADLIEPARKVFELTRRSFAAGESNVLALVDANNAYFDARARYQELLQECALASADLRLAAGLSLVDGKEYQP